MKPKTNLGIFPTENVHTDRILENVLADESQLCVTAKDFRQNAKGPQSSRLRRLFDRQARQVASWLRLISARSRAAGEMAQGGLARLARLARVPAPPSSGLAARTMLVELHALHAGLAQRLRADVAVCVSSHRDPGTASFLGELLEFHEAAALRLEALLANPRKEAT